MFDSTSNMEIIQLIIGVVLIVSVKFFIIRTIYSSIRISNLTGDDLKFDEIRPIYKRLKRGRLPENSIVKKYSHRLETRVLVYEVLNLFNKTELFPKELLKFEKFSESYLANWLNNNNDFESLPDEIEYKDKIELINGVTFLIFKVYEPHLLSNRDWMMGYVGYRSLKIDLYSEPNIIMSEFKDEILSSNQLIKITEL